MPTFQNILVAADFSQGSKLAFQVADAMAHAGGTRLVLLHVVEHLEVVAQPFAFGEVGVTRYPRAVQPGDAATLKERLCREYVPDQALEVAYQVREGKTWREIVRVAEETQPDLIVMGTCGRTGIDRLLAGSVAEAVMRRAPCPVLVVRAPAGAAASDLSLQAEAAGAKP